MDQSLRRFVAPGILTLIVLALWTRLVIKLSTDWSINPQYEFGFFVPFLILYLLARRWPDRPAISSDIPSGALWVLTFGLLAALLPLRVIEEGNPDWRPLTWLCAGVVVFATLIAVARIGGLPWVKHFAIPFALIFVAIPWPLAMEESVIQALTRGVTSLTAELLNWIGVPALQHGNVIEVSAGAVDVAEACSGIRSLQGTLMAAVFFGELYRCTVGKRFLLIGVGAVIALALNSCRTLFLAWIAAKQGIEAIGTWHDRAGYGIFVVSFALLWGAAWRMRSSESSGANEPNAPLPPVRIPVPGLIAIACWLLAVELLTGYWYRMHERDAKGAISWTLKWPEESGSFHFAPIPDKVHTVLRYSKAASGVLSEPGTPGWQMFFIQWDPGRTSAQLVSMHRPEICLPAHGLEFLSEGVPCEITTDNLSLIFHCSVFNEGGRPMYVFRCLWEERPMSGPGRDRTFDLSVSGRIASAWFGRRNLGEKLLQIAVVGAQSAEDATADIQKRLPPMIAVSR